MIWKLDRELRIPPKIFIRGITCFIEFSGFNRLLTKVVTVGFGHGAIAQQDDRLLSVYAIIALAVAIV